MEAALCGLQLSRLVIEEFQLPEFVEQRADFREPGRWPDLGLELKEIPARHHELGKRPMSADSMCARSLTATHPQPQPRAFSSRLGRHKIQTGRHAPVSTARESTR